MTVDSDYRRKLANATDTQLRNAANKRAPGGSGEDAELYAAITAEIQRRAAPATTQPESRPSGLLQRAGDVATAINQGITFGFGDEITGLLGALGSVGSEESFGDRYRGFRDASRQSLRELNPVARTGLEMAGGLMSGSGIGQAGRQLLGQANRALPQTVQPLAPKVAPRMLEPVTRTEAAATGAGAGGIAGLGASERPLTDPEIGTDVIFGAGTGGAFGAGTFINPTTREAIAMRARGLLGDTPQQEFPRRARRFVDRALSDEGLTREQAASRLASMPPGANVMDVGAMGGPLKSAGEQVMVEGGPAAARMERSMRSRLQDASARIDDMLSTLMGNPKSFFATKDQLDQKMKADSAPIYERYRAMTINLTPELEDIIRRIEASKPGQSNILERGRRLGYARGTLDVPGKGDEPIIDATVLDQAKKRLDQIIEKAIKDGDGDEAGSFKQLNDELKAELDRQTDGVYKAAREAFQGPAAMNAALEAGRKFMRQDPEEIQFTMRDFETETERTMFRLGAARAISDRIGNRAVTQRVGKELAAPKFVARINELFPNQPDANEKLIKAFNDEDDMFDTFVQLIQNSRTARRTAGADRMGNQLAEAAGEGLLTGQAMTLPMRMLSLFGRDLGAKGRAKFMRQNDQTKMAISDILLNGTPGERERMILTLNSDIPINLQGSARPGLLGLNRASVPTAAGIQGGLLVGENN